MLRIQIAWHASCYSGNATFWEEGYMPQALATPDSTSFTAANSERALRILSKSLYRELRQNGYEPKQIVSLATELVGLVTSDIRDEISVE